MKALFMMFHSDYLTEVATADVKDGKAVIGHKEYDVKKARPFIIKRLFGCMPLYMVNFDSGVPIEPQGFKVYDTAITPEMQKRSIELKMWHFLLKRFRAELPSASMMAFLMTTVLGMVVMYILFYMKIIPLPIR
jgi:hypothetical protein